MSTMHVSKTEESYHDESLGASYDSELFGASELALNLLPFFHFVRSPIEWLTSGVNQTPER